MDTIKTHQPEPTKLDQWKEASTESKEEDENRKPRKGRLAGEGGPGEIDRIAEEATRTIGDMWAARQKPAKTPRDAVLARKANDSRLDGIRQEFRYALEEMLEEMTAHKSNDSDAPPGEARSHCYKNPYFVTREKTPDEPQYLCGVDAFANDLVDAIELLKHLGFDPAIDDNYSKITHHPLLSWPEV